MVQILDIDIEVDMRFTLEHLYSSSTVWYFNILKGFPVGWTDVGTLVVVWFLFDMKQTFCFTYHCSVTKDGNFDKNQQKIKIRPWSFSKVCSIGVSRLECYIDVGDEYLWQFWLISSTTFMNRQHFCRFSPGLTGFIRSCGGKCVIGTKVGRSRSWQVPQTRWVPGWCDANMAR